MRPELASALVQALVQGSLYALIGVGFVILYRSTGVLNFAQGSLMVLGGFSFYQLTEWGLPLIVAIPLSVIDRRAHRLGIVRRRVPAARRRADLRARGSRRSD